MWILPLLLAYSSVVAAEPPPQVLQYLHYLVAYAPYAETIWHGAADGGYWGDGLAGGNGGIRGTSNLTLAFAMLVYAEDQGWLSDAQRERLAEAGLGRVERLDRVRGAWRYLARCHVTGGGFSATDKKKWGRSWQSSLWVGASGLAALLVWSELDGDVRTLVERVVVDEADQKIEAKPRDATPGNTAAEENGWDTHAPAIAVALFPTHPNALKWLRTAQVLAANTYSVRADHTSDALLGDERVRDVVTTANLFDDFTLDNHGFFHPSYLKVSGQEIGEAWAMTALGDRLHGTSFAQQLKPYALHHVADTWQVLRRLLLPEGEFAFPSGSDWAIHLPTAQSYFAFIATALHDPVAALAERRGFTAARWGERASPAGRFLGASNFEWWWEPIALKRFCTAMLHFALCADPPAPAPEGGLANYTETFASEPTQILLHRTPRYFASVSRRGRPTGLVIPLGEAHLDHPYVTTPRVGGLLPPGAIESCSRYDHEFGTALLMRCANGTSSAMVALRNVVLWVTNEALGPLGVQNDNVVPGTGRTVRWESGSRHVPPLTPMEPFATGCPWLNIDDQLGLISEAGFRYVPAGKYTRRSAAEDLVGPLGGERGTCLLVAPRYSAAETKQLADAFSVAREGRRHVVTCQDGIGGPTVRITLDLGRGSRFVAPVDLAVAGSVAEHFPVDGMTDGDPSTYGVLRNQQGNGPTPDAPIVLEFALPETAGLPSAVRIVPRPLYGPREVALEVRRAGVWEEVAGARLSSDLADIPLPAGGPVERYRLVITSGWDRGGELAEAPRNTQLAELSFILRDAAEAAESGPPTPFEIRVLAVGQPRPNER